MQQGFPLTAFILKLMCDPGPQTSLKLIYTSSESWLNMLSIDVWRVRIGRYLENISKKLFENLESESAKKSKYCENPL